jgi:ketosteroid isomerase-like protein
MALERAPELEQAHEEFAAALRGRDMAALREMISAHPATASRGTDPTEVVRGRDELLAAIENEPEGEYSFTDNHCEAYAEGDLGYVYAESILSLPNGAEFPLRGLVVAHREDGRWRFHHGLNAIPVANELLTPASPLALRTTAASG